MSIFSKKKEIRDLRKKLDNAHYSLTPKLLRKNVRILVIDDKEFSPQSNLKRLEYDISHESDIDRIDDVVNYDIVLVDIKGVGTNINAQQQGAFLIKEIKSAYPEKTVIAYTGGATDELTITAHRYADDYFRKDSAIEDWVNLLDRHILNLSDPVELWISTRERLLRSGMGINKVADLECLYASGFDGKKFNLQKLIKESEKGSVEVRKVIKSVSTHASLKLIELAISSGS